MDILISQGETFVRTNGEPYIGPYYIDIYNVAYVYDPSTKIPERLVHRKVYYTEFMRNRISEKGGYTSPKPYIPHIEEVQLTNNSFYRFFCQRRNNPLLTIVEIDELQYDNIEEGYNNNFPSLTLYNKIKINWMVRGDVSYVESYNRNQIKNAELDFKGITQKLKNPLEFYKITI